MKFGKVTKRASCYVFKDRFLFRNCRDEMGKAYIHGYDPSEKKRLQDQANTLVELFHSDTSYSVGSRILEVGCGVGSQTITLARKSPNASFLSIDISEESICEAREALEKCGLKNVQFICADIFNFNIETEPFDHVFVCHVLEHLSQPEKALSILKNLIKEGGTITVIEGDHGSTYFYPDSEAAQKVIQCQVELQNRTGGNANIGRELYPLLNSVGFKNVMVSPKLVYVDSSKPGLVDGFTKNTFTAMIEGVRESSIAAGLINGTTFDDGIKALYRTTEQDGVFSYTFFKAIGTKR